jgi:serine/threonine protein kinase/Tol biopolymer transport system component
MPLASGTKLGPYEIQSPLGAGGMGEVYRARDTRLDRTVAIKVLPHHLSSNPDLKQRFEREARAISSLNHPRICTLHDVGHQDGVDFLVMEHLDGESLAERLKKGPLPLKEALKTGIEVCQALEAAQRAGIVHRDLKPGNIMLTKGGAKLMDFGLAKAMVTGFGSAASSAPLLSGARTMSEATPLSPLTSVGMVIGTIQYMAPEQIEGKEADARSDLFALGAVLYETTTGKRPFDGKSQISVASAILEKDPDPIRTLKPSIPAVFERVVNTCMAKNPDDRFQTAHDVRLELEWIAADLPQLGVSSATKTAKPVARALPWIIAAAAVLLAIGMFVLTGRESPAAHYTNVSYRDGTLLGARFSHDGQTIVYSGKWEGEPPQISVARVGSPESRPLGIASSEIAAVSSSDELAIFLGCEEVYFLTCGGTLATVSLAGGSPRTLAEHVAQADWHPDGKRMVIAVQSPEGPRLEFPPGHVLFQQRGGWIGHPRFSPDGARIAFESHPILGNDDGSIDLVDLNGNHTVISTDPSVEGLAWRPDGKEVWFAGTKVSGWADTLFAVTPNGKERTILTFPSIRLHDISKDGRVLLSRETWRRQIRGLFPGDKAEHPYSWLDDTEATGISDDGRVVSIYEAGEVYALENNSLAYYRATDGSPAVRLGIGTAAISPDGKWVVLASNHGNPKLPLQLQPIGPGDAKELPTPGLIAFDHYAWSGDGRQIVYEAQTDQNKWNIYKQAVAGGAPVLIKTDAREAYPVLSPDGETVALREARGGISLYHRTDQQPVALKVATADEFPVRFVKDGKALLTVGQSGGELVLTVIDLASGHREPWKRIPDDYASHANQLLVATPDLKYYAYPFPRYSSVLYTVENLH